MLHCRPTIDIVNVDYSNVLAYRPIGKVISLTIFVLKEYYEIVDEARPLLGFFSHTC